MASTAPAKSQPLHNFTLPHHLKWNKDGQSSGGGHHQRRRSIKSPSRRPNASSPSPVRHSPRHQSPPRDAPHYAVEHPSVPGLFRRHDSAPESVDYQPKIDGSRNMVVSSTNPEKSPQTKSKGKEIEACVIKKSKILIKIPCKSNPKPEEEIPIPKIVEDDESIDEETKVWNLRPRKAIRRPMSSSGEGYPVRSEKKKAHDSKKKKVSVFVSLSKEEIEEDIFSLTGSKPARRPKKRPKIVQRNVDAVFPGTWLLSISADSYKVSENSLKA